MLKINSKKGQVSTSGLITGLIFGIASLVIAVIIAFVIVSTLTDANLLTEGRATQTYVNESGWINGTTYTLAHYTDANTIRSTIVVSLIVNSTSGATIPAGNYTVTNGVIRNTTSDNFPAAKITYSYTKYSNTEVSSTALNANLTSGVNNVSEKIPTVLLVAAIVLILGILALLVGVWQRMRMGGGGI